MTREERLERARDESERAWNKVQKAQEEYEVASLKYFKIINEQEEDV